MNRKAFPAIPAVVILLVVSLSACSGTGTATRACDDAPTTANNIAAAASPENTSTIDPSDTEMRGVGGRPAVRPARRPAVRPAPRRTTDSEPDHSTSRRWWPIGGYRSNSSSCAKATPNPAATR